MPDPQQDAALREQAIRDAILQKLLGGTLTPDPVASHAQLPSTGPMGPTRIGPEHNRANQLELLRDPVTTQTPAELQRAAQLAGQIKPSLDQAPFAGPMALGSFFGTNQALRQRMTQRTMQKLTDLLVKHQVPAATQQEVLGIAERYPRVMAHIADVQATPADWISRGAYGAEPNVLPQLGDTAAHTRRGTLKLGIGPGEFASVAPDYENLPRTFAHELTHAAQNIRHGGKMPELYEQAQEAAGSYRQNPFEIGARSAAERKVGMPTFGKPLQSRSANAPPRANLSDVLADMEVMATRLPDPYENTARTLSQMGLEKELWRLRTQKPVGGKELSDVRRQIAILEREQAARASKK